MVREDLKRVRRFASKLPLMYMYRGPESRPCTTNGSNASANNVQAFLANTRHRLGDKQVAWLRADSGFSDTAFLDHLELERV